MSLFEAYLVIDWSSRNKPSPKRESKDAIWVGEGFSEAGKPNSIASRYFTTRWKCIEYVRERLQSYVDQKRRVFVGFDFAYGYPAGYAAALGLQGATKPWRSIWDALFAKIEDEADNKNNRFEVASWLNERCGGLEPGPLWGRPQNKAGGRHLSVTAPQFPFKASSGVTLSNLRRTDQNNRGIQSVWKLFYPGSVGGQSLVGIPQLKRLRDDPDLADFSRVWPFETGFTKTPLRDEGLYILHAEIWPGILKVPADLPWNDNKQRRWIRDEWQVEGMVKWLTNLDATDDLAEWFDTPSELSTEEENKTFIDEEGWILGAGWQNPTA